VINAMPKKALSVPAAAVEMYDTFVPLVESMHGDVRELSRKSQTSPLSKSRIEMINRLLGNVKESLKNEPTVAYLPLLDEALLPQNADALLILGQFEAAMKEFKEKYAEYDPFSEQYVWRILGKRIIES
jgi:hypothetical protein